MTQASTPGRSLLAVYSDLFKARLTFLVLLTTLVGFYLGSGTPLNLWILCHTMVGTALLASGAASLNQYLERNLDAKMARTAERPLPAGELQPGTVLILGAVISSAGMVYLAAAVNPLTSFLGALTLGSYLFVYTPLKRVTPLNTVIGAIPGALPPLMGWTAATGEISVGGWSLFAILFFWQLPHFLAIAWIYREQYAKAGFAMLSVVDPDGLRTGRQAISHTLGLLPISLAPFVLGMTGRLYLLGALVLGLLFLWKAIVFARDLTSARAKSLFMTSIIYLPLLLGLMVVNSIKN